MKYYVVATDRRGCEMTPTGQMFEKHIITCNDLEQAKRVQAVLKARTPFSAIQMTQNIPDLNPRIYRKVESNGARWLQGR